TDGDHTIEAVAISGGSYIGSPSSTATVDNTLDSPGRVQADLDAAKIDSDTYVVNWGDALLSPSNLEPRYSGPASTSGGGSVELLAGYADHWDKISTSTKDTIRARHAPDLTVGPPAGAPAGATQGLDPGPSTYPGCTGGDIEFGDVLFTVGVWCTQVIRYSAATCELEGHFSCEGDSSEVPDFKFYFTVGTGSGDVEDDPNSVLGTVVPQYLIDAANSMFLAYETYDELGYELGGNIQFPYYMDVMVSDQGQPYANPYCGSCHGLLPRDYGIRIDPSDAFATPRHESFHIVQFNYVSEYDVLSEAWPGNIGRETTWWWLEATAEWADHQVVELRDISDALKRPTEYASRLDDFADDPEKKLTEFKASGDQK
ncbi:MAG: hypothetical protein GY788_12525, partial [bacterium]|nr:hypothetical protein [bacterium]